MRLVYEARLDDMLGRSGDSDKRRGFALVLALSLMSFTLLLLLSMTLLIQIETKNAVTALDQLRAREAAKLALYIAIGELQKHAGPDKRVTARADVMGDSIPDEHRFWTGVWDTSNPTNTPQWLVSGNNPQPEQEVSAYSVFPKATTVSSETHVPRIKLSDQSTEIGWWIVDEGIKAPLQVQETLSAAFKDLEDGAPVLYTDEIIRSSSVRQDPTFDFPDFFDSTEPPEGLDRLLATEDLLLLLTDKESSTKERIESQLQHAVSLTNRFVIANTREGGLKKDLSYLGAIGSDSITQENIDELYQDPDGLIRSDAVQLLRHRADPSSIDSGPIISEPSPAAISVKEQHFSLAPVVTEFQLSLGVASQDGELSDSTVQESPLFLAHKLYLELWNPYTVPFRLGDPATNWSDLRIEIRNLPTYHISNHKRDVSVSGTLSDISILWSDLASPNTMRPGMVFLRTLPPDNGGDYTTGVLQQNLGITLNGSRTDHYTGSFTFAGPVEVELFARDVSGNERSFFTGSIENYPNFKIEYDPSDRSTWFKRKLSSKDGAFGMNDESLERQGYAFAFRFRMLDEQDPPGAIRDISNWMSLHEIRRPSFQVDLSTWDINDAWTSDPPLPYDFSLGHNAGTNPGLFEPTESFSELELFHYHTGSASGRRDRIARMIDFPISEPTSIGLFRTLLWRDHPSNAVGSPWGGPLNQLYDRYFFSTLPTKPSNGSTWDGRRPLLNNRIKPTVKAPTLENPETAQNLYLENGFNLNSTEPLAWEKVLSGLKFPVDQLEAKYERGSSHHESPEWFTINKGVEQAWINFPQTALFNLTEREDQPRFEFVSKSDTENYIEQFSINSTNWQNDRQHPAFVQPIRELNQATIESLSRTVVTELKKFYADNDRPPFSIAEFLNSGVLQDAINETPEINNRIDGVDMVPTHAAASITQATLMNLLGQFAFVRSDTFKIRATAKITNPTSGMAISAICEATLQRTPAMHANSALGRKFELIHLKWLEPLN